MAEIWVRYNGSIAGFVICHASGERQVPAGEGVALV